MRCAMPETNPPRPDCFTAPPGPTESGPALPGGINGTLSPVLHRLITDALDSAVTRIDLLCRDETAAVYGRGKE